MQHDDIYKIVGMLWIIGHMYAGLGFRVWVHTCGKRGSSGQRRCLRGVEAEDEVEEVVDIEEVVVHVRSRSSRRRTSTSSSSGSMENMVASGYKARTKVETQIGYGDAGTAV